MTSGIFDFLIEEGSCFDETIVWYDSDDDLQDLTGYTGKMEIRKNWSDATVLLTIDVSPAAGEGTMTMGGAAGTIRLQAGSNLTRALAFDRGVYDLEVSPSGAADLNADAATDVLRILEGIIIFTREVTR